MYLCEVDTGYQSDRLPGAGWIRGARVIGVPG